MTIVAGGIVLMGIAKLEHYLLDRTGRDLQWAAMEIAEKIDLLLAERHGDIKLITGLLREVDNKQWIQHFQGIREAYPIYAWIGLLDKAGRVVVATDPDTIGKEVLGLGRDGTVGNTPAVMVQETRRDALVKGQHTVGFAGPITFRTGTGRTSSFEGTLVTRIRLSELDPIVTRSIRAMKEKMQFRQGVEYQVLNKQGQVLIESLQGAEELPNLLALGVKSAKLATAGETGFILEEHARRPVEVLTGYAPLLSQDEVRVLGWGVLVRLDSRAALGPVRSAIQTVTTWGVAILLPLWILLIWTVRRLKIERREVEVARQASQEIQETYQSILNNALDAHILVDQHGTITGWNPKSEELFGLSGEEAIGQPVDRISRQENFSSESMPGLETGLETVLEDRRGALLKTRFESNVWHKSGRLYPVELTFSPIKRPSGYLYSLFLRDITEQKQEEQYRTVKHRITELLLEASSLESASQEIIKTVCQTLGWQVGALWAVQDTERVLRYVEGWCADSMQFASFLERSRTAHFAVGVGLPGRAWERGGVEWIVDVSREDNLPRARDAQEVGLHAALAIPIKFDRTVKAVMEFFSNTIQPPNHKLMDIFDHIAGQLSQFLKRRVMEQNLKRSEARFSGILQLASDAIISTDHLERIILFNKGAETIFGYTAGEALGRSISILIPSRYREGHGRHVREFGASSASSKVMSGAREIYGVRKSGWEFPAEASIAKVTVDGQTTYTVILRDVSRRKEEEVVIKAAKQKAEDLVHQKEALMASVEAFFIQMTESDVICEWTRQAEKQFDIHSVNAIGRKMSCLPIEWDWAIVNNGIRQVMRTLEPVYINKIALGEPGDRRRFLKLVLSPLKKDYGVDIVLMGEDITEYLALEQDLAQAHKLEAVGQLAAGVAHEINTPTQFVGDNLRFLSDTFSNVRAVLDQHRGLLASAKTGLCAPELIARCEAEVRLVDLDYLTDEAPKAIAQSIEGVERIARIVSAMKEFAHPGGDEKASVNLNKAIETTIEISRNEWRYVADLRADLAPDLPRVFCQLGPINQVILNIIVNAAHAIEEVVKGTVQKGQITVTSRGDDDWVEIAIADTGGGIPQVIIQKIFDPFFTTKPLGKGTGQGLAIAHSVVDKHGGTIAVESEVGRGTTFIIRLPVNMTEEHKSKAKAA